MINLIPPQAKAQMKREYWLRVGVVWLLLLSTVLIFFAGLLVPSFVLIDGQLRVYEQQAASASAVAGEQEVLKDIVANTNRETKAVLALGAIPVMTPYLERIESLQGKEIQLNQVQVIRTKTDISSIVVSGQAANRQALTAFSSRLVQDERFIDAPVPLENLAANENIVFSITIGIAPQL